MMNCCYTETERRKILLSRATALMNQFVEALMGLENEDKEMYLRLFLRSFGDSHKEIDRMIERIFRK